MNNKRIKSNYFVIPGVILLVLGLGRWLTMQGIGWYHEDLLLPALTPPDWAFSLVWTIIGTLTAISLLIVWNKCTKNAYIWIIMGLFGANGTLNILWSYFFFYKKNTYAAFLDAQFIFLSIAFLIAFLWRCSRLAALLLVPYALWVLFALYLNYEVWLINEA